MSTISKSGSDKSYDSLAGLRFLVVDDHKFSRHITMEALKWLNVNKVTEAVDAKDAISVLQAAASYDRSAVATNALAKRFELSDDRLFGQGKVDCVITDFNMQPMNGLHLLKAIRTGVAACARDTPVLMLTGYSDDYLIAAALSLDLNAFVMKPVSRTTLSEKLRRILMRPIDLQKAEIYEAVKVPECDELRSVQPESLPEGLGSEAPAQSDAKQELENRTLETVKLTEIFENEKNYGHLFLGEDLVIGEDLQDAKGAVFIHRGTKLTVFLLEELRKLHGLGKMPDQLKVFR
jgi:CheY-like chemotaxis protein